MKLHEYQKSRSFFELSLRSHRFQIPVWPTCSYMVKTFKKTPSPDRRRSGGAMVLAKLSLPGRPTDVDKSMARANCACS